MAFEYKPPEGLGALLSEEMKEFMRNDMKATSDRPKTIPQYFYHATPVKNLSSILENGLKVHDVYGEIYFCAKEKEVLKFIPRPCVVVKIATGDLNKEDIYLSSDHVKTRSRNFDAFTYYADIEPDKIKSWRAFQ